MFDLIFFIIFRERPVNFQHKPPQKHPRQPTDKPEKQQSPKFTDVQYHRKPQIMQCKTSYKQHKRDPPPPRTVQSRKIAGKQRNNHKSPSRTLSVKGSIVREIVHVPVNHEDVYPQTDQNDCGKNRRYFFDCSDVHKRHSL